MNCFYSEGEQISNTRIVYDSNEESIIMEPSPDSDFTLMLGSAYLGLDINLDTREVVGISGFCPKRNWENKMLSIPKTFEDGKLFFQEAHQHQIGTGAALFDESTIYFDEGTNWCCLKPKTTWVPGKRNIRLGENLIVCLAEQKLVEIWFKPIVK